MCRLIWVPVGLALAIDLSASDGPYVRLDAMTLRPVSAPAGPDIRVIPPGAERAISLVFEHSPIVLNGTPVPGGGFLDCDGDFHPAAMNASGQIAFYSQISGAERNQGMFRAEVGGLIPIAIGCGDIGGSGQPGPCGDPTPVGGTFAGMFGGSFIVPAINDLGDVLFLSDIYQGPGLRGLFLYRSAENDIVKVAVFGDPSPLGGTITGLGPGSINNARQVVFFAETDGAELPDILLYHDGVLSVVAAMGQASPTGGTFGAFSLEAIGWSDGTMIPCGTVPDINDAGDIAFYGWIENGPYERIIVFQHNGINSAWLRNGDPTPYGGHCEDFWAPCLNNSSEMALLVDFTTASGQTSSAWIAGHAPLWRKVLTFNDLIEGAPVWMLAVSRNPVNILDDCGDVAVWCMVIQAGVPKDRMLMVDRTGARSVVARYGDPSPLGGTLTSLEAWPSLNDFAQIVVGADVSGGSTVSTYLLSGIGNAPGDANHDGVIDAVDWAELPACLGRPDACPTKFANRVFDFDGDVDVDLRDVAGFQAAFGE
jgi:hypothetical protein